MPDSHTANAAGLWSVPQCPFAIDYSARVLDDIRLAVTDAFFSLPRGGAEIGGVLLGAFATDRLTISDYVPLDCEHAFGPSFTLSPRDEVKLEELLAAARMGAGGAPVGWYHSHTRSEIFLSDADLAIHQRFFPEAWQVALVMKPHTFQPMRCGFFFRDPDGAIQSASTYREFTLDPLPMRPIPTGEVPVENDTPNPERRQPDPAGKVIDISANRVGAAAQPMQDEPAPVLEPKRETVHEPVEPPGLGEPPSRSAPWLKAMLAIALGAAVAGAGYQTRQRWWPRVAGLFPSSTFAPIGLTTTDRDGQLQIQWDRNSPTIRQAVGARLSITDVGPAAREINLDPVRLQSGNFTYAREGEAVTVLLTLDEPNGSRTHEVSTFVGKLPERTPPVDSELRSQRDALATEAAGLRQELATQVDRNRKLQKALDSAQKQLREQTRKRLGNQIPK